MSGATFPLVSRRRLVGLAFGAMHGQRRGSGTDVAGSRAYVPGDDPDRIDWAASARLSSARDTDQFVVREHYADESPRAVIVSDRRRPMASVPGWVPWLDKDAAARAAAELIEESIAEARGMTGVLELVDDPGHVLWCPPGQSTREHMLVDEAVPSVGGDADWTGVGSAFAFLALHRRAVPSASFVFVLSDLLAPPPLASWEWALDRGWDVVPVIIQDPVWEQSFPDVDRIVVPLTGPDGERRLVRLRSGESARLREEHEERLGRLLADLRSLGIGCVVVSDSALEHVLDAFLTWSTDRQAWWGAAA